MLVASAGITYRYVAADPFEYDIKRLRSEGEDAVLSRDVMATSDKNFGRGYSGRTYIAADRLAQVPMIAKALRALDTGLPDDKKTIGDVRTYLDAVPDDQPAKLAVLAEIRTMLDDKALDALSDDERKDLHELRPPDDLQPITMESLPAALREPMTEKDGRIGYLISIRPANKLDEWNGHDNIRFANAIRKLQLPDGETVTTSGSAVIFADILVSISGDGPLRHVDRGRWPHHHGGAARRAKSPLVRGARRDRQRLAADDRRVRAARPQGQLPRLRRAADHARHRRRLRDQRRASPRSRGGPDPLTTLRTSGAAVFVCSLTTIIGYGSLLVSDNLAIRGFGTASLIGECTCLLAALILVPALLAVGRRGQLTRLPAAAAISR